MNRLSKVEDTEKDQDYQKMRGDLIDWLYARLKSIEDRIQSREVLDPKRLESLNKEREYLLNLESSVPRTTRLSKTIAGLDGRGIEVFQEAGFTRYPKAVRNGYLQAALDEVEGEYQEWTQEQETRRKYRDLAGVGTDLYTWWQKRVHEAQQIVTASQADLAQLKRVKALLAGEARLLNHENLVEQSAKSLADSGVIEAKVFNSGSFTPKDQYDHLVAVMDTKSTERADWEKRLGIARGAETQRAEVKQIDDQMVKLGALKELLERGKSLSLSPPLRAALKDLDGISRYVFKSDRYARYPQASQYLAAMIDHNNKERKAWEEALQ